MRLRFPLLVLFALMTPGALTAADRPRLAILTDIGGDPDDTQSLIRLLHYANEFEIEALLTSAAGVPGELKESITRPDLVHKVIDGYESVLPNFRKHAQGWSEAKELRQRVVSGNPHRGRDHIGEGHDTDGSRLLIKLIDSGTPERPLNISIWGGQTDFAQTLYRVKKDRDGEGYKTFVGKFRVYDIGDQDVIAAWMRTEFPGMYYILAQAPAGADKRESTYRGMYLTGDDSLTSRDWVDKNVRSTGPLGALYPTQTHTNPNPHRCLKEGDTPSWFFFLPLGGNDPKDPTKPGWGGQFRREADGWYGDIPKTDSFDRRTTVSQWRPKFQEDFARRAAWAK
jgi:hypothetical protein